MFRSWCFACCRLILASKAFSDIHLKRIRSLRSTRELLSSDSFAVCRKICRQASRVDWSCGRRVLVNSSWQWRKLRTHHVCADGKRSVERSSRWIWNFWVPFIPSNAPNPCNGTFDVPVTNCRNLARSAWSKLRKARQNHWICLINDS